MKGPLIPTFVGRESELIHLHSLLDKALHGVRQIVFVTGEPGIGKTTLLNAFRQGLETRGWRLGLSSKVPNLKPLAPRLWMTGGQCIEHYGSGEAYLPVLEALGRLCREQSKSEILALLLQHAPSWLVQMPTLLTDVELEALQRKTQGVTRERMLREFAEALEVLTAERPLVLVLEDLHWSDVSTLDLLCVLAQRHDPARLLILGTYRPVEVLTRDHPLKGIKQELQLHGQCEELALYFLSEENVAEYLAQRFGSLPSSLPQSAFHIPQSPVPLRSLAQLVHERTDGNPLFMVNVTNELFAHGIETRDLTSFQSLEELGIGVPESLRQLIAHQFTRVGPEERQILEAASVAGAEFSAVAVSAGVEQSTEAVETYCERLVRREQFLRAQGTSEWPDGTIAARYGFVHALYQEVLYEQISATRRSRLHRQIGERQEQGYGEHAKEIAAELAMHFERGRDYERAVEYLQQAGENAVRRSANKEAERHLTTGLKLLYKLPDTPMRTQQELTLQLTLGALCMATKGFAAPEVERAYHRALALCEQTGEQKQIFTALRGLALHYTMRLEHQTARRMADQLLGIAQQAQDPDLLIEAHRMQGGSRLWIGEFLNAHAHLESGMALYDPQKHRTHAFRYGQDPGVACRLLAFQVLWILGYPDQALKRAQEAFTLAQEFSHVNTRGYGLACLPQIHLFRGEWHAAQARAEVSVTFATEMGLPYFFAQQSIILGSALAAQGHNKDGIEKMRQGLAAQRATGGQGLQQLWLALQVEAYIVARQFAEGWTALEEALAIRPKYGERYWETELYRLQGALLLAQDDHNPKGQNNRRRVAIEAKAEEFFQQAINTARELNAKSFELRSVTSLARLWQRQGKTVEAHRMLSEVYNWFTEGFDTKDLREAKALLEELGH